MRGRPENFSGSVKTARNTHAYAGEDFATGKAEVVMKETLQHYAGKTCYELLRIVVN